MLQSPVHFLVQSIYTYLSLLHLTYLLVTYLLVSSFLFWVLISSLPFLLSLLLSQLLFLPSLLFSPLPSQLSLSPFLFSWLPFLLPSLFFCFQPLHYLVSCEDFAIDCGLNPVVVSAGFGLLFGLHMLGEVCHHVQFHRRDITSTSGALQLHCSAHVMHRISCR